eukprot:jgi/Tetstr1/455544/TSEL_042366.t1
MGRQRNAATVATARSYAALALMGYLAALGLRPVAPFPSRYGQQNGYAGCTLPTTGYGRHGSPQDDSGITFQLLDLSTLSAVTSFMSGATYKLQVVTASSDLGFLLASAGAFGEPDLECGAQRETFDSTRASERVASWTAPESDVDTVTFSANFASGATQPYRQNTATFPLDTSGAPIGASTPSPVPPGGSQSSPSTATPEATAEVDHTATPQPAATQLPTITATTTPAEATPPPTPAEATPAPSLTSSMPPVGTAAECECAGASCYCFYPDSPLPWPQAQQACAQQGAGWALAVPDSAAELAFIVARMSAGQPAWWPAIFHIGASRSGPSQPWLTPGGASFAPPAPGWCWLYTPDEEAMNCAYHSGLCGGLSNQACDQTVAYACEGPSGNAGGSLPPGDTDQDELPRVSFTAALPSLDIEQLRSDRALLSLLLLAYQDLLGRLGAGAAGAEVEAVRVEALRGTAEGGVEADVAVLFPLDI